MSSDKKALRKAMSKRRAEAFDTVSPRYALESLSDMLRACDGPISFYWPIRTEIDPRPVMNAMAARTQVCLPMTHGFSALTFRPWTPGAAMVEDSFGVAVPDTSETVVPKTLVVPLLAFDERGHRLGYGAGHYDRTLEVLRETGPVMAIGFAFEAQRAGALPIEPTDQPLNAIVTEAGLRRFSA